MKCNIHCGLGCDACGLAGSYQVSKEHCVTGQLLPRIYLGDFFFCYRSPKGFGLHKHKPNRGWAACYSERLCCLHGSHD
jgi:hypothetical protein